MNDLRQYPVVINMVPIVARGVGQDQSFQPLDTSASNLTWYNGSEGTSVVRTQRFSVHLMSKHYSSVGVHGPVQFYGCSVMAIRL